MKVSFVIIERTFLFICLMTNVICFEPISTITSAFGIVALAASYASWNYLKCSTQECCHLKNERPKIINKGMSIKKEPWIHYELPLLNDQLSDHLYGQPLAQRIVSKLIKSHMDNDDPRKPLVLSFHGWTGCGKNHVTRIIASNLYQKFAQSQRSDFVNLFIATHFQYDDIKNINDVKQFLKNNVTEGVKRCPRSLFIFDEIDKMPSGVIDVIKPFLDYHPSIDGVDYRKAIFIFLSNTGGTEITKTAYKFWRNGNERKDITMKDLEPLINSGAFNEIGGLHMSDIVTKNLIDAYIPFLPLERKHVILCIKDYLKKRYNKLSTDVGMKFIESVADEMEYFPPDTNLYSKSGCKRVENKVDAMI